MPQGISLRDAARFVPDAVRLVRGLRADPELPRSVRWWLGALLAYIALPVDIIPDFIPVLGYADDVIVIRFVLRRVVRAVGSDAFDRHWTGSPAGLALIKRLAGLPA